MTNIQFTSTDNFIVRLDDLSYLDDSKAIERSYKRQALKIVGKDCLRGLYGLGKATINGLDVWVKSIQ